MALWVGMSPHPRDESWLDGRIQLYLIDGFRLVIDAVDVHPCAVCRRLLAVLALRGDSPRSVVAGILWPDSSERRAHGSLRTALWKLRRIETGLVWVRGGRLRLGPDVRVDVESLLGWARQLVERPTTADAQLILGAPQGDLLPGWYEDWVLVEREELRQLRLHALESAANQLGVRGRYAEGITAALEAVRLEPLRETAYRTLLGLHIAEGNIGEAVRNFREFRALARAELGADPSPDLTAMMAARAPAVLHDAAPRGLTRPAAAAL